MGFEAINNNYHNNDNLVGIMANYFWVNIKTTNEPYNYHLVNIGANNLVGILAINHNYLYFDLSNYYHFPLMNHDVYLYYNLVNIEASYYVVGIKAINHSINDNLVGIKSNNDNSEGFEMINNNYYNNVLVGIGANNFLVGIEAINNVCFNNNLVNSKVNYYYLVGI